MLYYITIIISVEQMNIMGIFVSETELNKSKIIKHFILMPDSDGKDNYASPFRQM